MDPVVLNYAKSPRTTLILYLDALGSLEPSLEFCMEAGLKLQASTLPFLLDLRAKTDRLLLFYRGEHDSLCSATLGQKCAILKPNLRI